MDPEHALDMHSTRESAPPAKVKVVITGGGGFVAQNLVPVLLNRGYAQITLLDKNAEGLAAQKQRHPGVTIAEVDLSRDADSWAHHFAGAGAVIQMQAQIGGHDDDVFLRNNCESTRLVLEAVRAHRVPYLLHISSSVIVQAVPDRYSRTKSAQEKMVVESGIPHTVLRPTLMFGHHNRNHFGWLKEIMRKFHIMPVPGNGRYVRQPLFVEDFCGVIAGCLERRPLGQVFMIAGREKIDYIDCLRLIRKEMGVFCPIVTIPYALFHHLLKLWALLSGKAMFNTEQLQALTARDVFEVIDWENLFGVKATPLREAFHRTYHPSLARD